MLAGTEHPDEARAGGRLPALAGRSRKTCRCACSSFPVAEDAELPEEFERWARRAERPAVAAAEQVAAEQRADWVRTVDRPDVRLSGARRGRVGARGGAGRFLGAVLRLPAGSIVGSVIGRVADRATCSATTGCAQVIWFTTLAGRGVHGAHARGRAAGGLPAGAVPVPGTVGAAGRDAGGVRAADRRGGRGVRGAATLARRAVRGARLLQPRRGRARRRRASGRSSTRPSRTSRRRWARRGSGGSPTCCCPLPRPSIVGAATLVFLFTFTSFGVALLLAGPSQGHDRGRDLPADLAAAEPAGGRGPHAGAARDRRRRCCGSPRVTESRAGVRQRSGRTGRRGPRAAHGRASARSWPSRRRVLGGRDARAARCAWSGARCAPRAGFTLHRYLDLGSVRRGSALPISALDAVDDSLRVAAGAGRDRARRRR